MKSITGFSIENQYYPYTVSYYSHARYALVAAFKLLDIKNNDRIALPEFICHDLLASLAYVDAIPVYYPVNTDLQADLSSTDLLDVKAIVVVDYFGFAQDLDDFKQFSSTTGATIIEDNAHGFLSQDENGELLGARTGIGLLSLRKTFPVPDGAALLIDDQYNNNVEHLRCNNKPLSKGYRLKSFLGNIQNRTGIRLRSYSETLTRFIRKLRTGHSLPAYSKDSESIIPGIPSMHCESVRLLKTVNPDSEVKRRRDLYILFQEELKDLNIEPIFSDLPLGVVPFGYPFRASQNDAAIVTQVAHKKGFSCAHWPDLPVAIKPNAPGHYKNVWWVNFLC